MAFQIKNKTDLFLNKQQVIFPVQITPAHQLKKKTSSDVFFYA